MKTSSSDETKTLAKKLLKQLKGKHVLALYGSLGSGKTTFTQGLAATLGVNSRILSPTFVLLRSYELDGQAFKNLHHLDLYRIESLQDALSTGIEELLAEEDSLVVIEWPEVIETILPKTAVKVKFKTIENDEREIEVI